MRAAAFLLLLVAVSPPSTSQAQDGAVSRPNAVYLEAGGNGGLYSGNYERLVSPRLGFRAGIAVWTAVDFWGGSDVQFVNLPLTLSFLPGGRGSGWEWGGGLLLGRKGDENADHGLGDDPGSGFGGILNLTAILGYRWVTDGGWMSRIGVTPFYSLAGGYPEDGFFPSVGLSLGKAF